MNNQNKINLILFIANTFNDEQCANLLKSFTENISAKRAMAWAKNAAAALVVANSAQWEESDHPRENDGRFAPKGRAGAPRPPECSATVRKPRPEPKPSDVKKRLQTLSDQFDPDADFMGESSHASIMDRIFGMDDDDVHKDIPTNAIRRLEPRARRLFEGYEDCNELRKHLEEAKSKNLTGNGGGQTPRQVLLEKLLKLQDGKEEPGWYYKPTRTGKYLMNEPLAEQLKIVEQLMEEEKISASHSKNQKRYKRYRDVDDELEEMYGDRDKGFGMKWPKSEDADADRKRYRKLLKERKRLDKQINWDDLDEE